MTSRWFRVYEDMVDDPKVQRLPDATFKALVNLWCLASAGEGTLPPLDDIAFKLRMKPERVMEILAGLKNAGLIDDDETGIHPHNWTGRQFKSDVSNERVKRHRERQRNVTPTVTVTPPDSDSETDSKKVLFNGNGNSSGVPHSKVEAVVKRAGGKKATKSNYCWLKPTDTRVPLALKWWTENYPEGPALPLTTRPDGKSGYSVPWEAVSHG